MSRKLSVGHIRKLVAEQGTPYSELLGINLDDGDHEIAKWFLAAVLFAKPIRETTAMKTYRVLERRGFLGVDQIIGAGWDRLVAALDEGGYTRYDFSTADKLLLVFQRLKTEYGGSLTRLYESSVNSQQLEDRVRALGKGIGPATVSIFLRDMRRVWPRAQPKPTPIVERIMKRVGIKDLGKYAARARLDPVRLETALFRLEKEGFRKLKKSA